MSKPYVMSLVYNCRIRPEMWGKLFRRELLHDDIQRRLTYIVYRLYTDTAGVGIPTVRRKLDKHGMLQYGSIKYAKKYLSRKDYWYLEKRYVRVRTVLRKRKYTNEPLWYQ